ncbi:MAG TPA: hypothetical protein VFH94_04475, partial [Streptomyces sp.]|nr:hypothetical protein [Streptomyces sp.]
MDSYIQGRGPSRRTVAGAAALAGIGAVVGAPGLATAAPAAGDESRLRSRELDVRVDSRFPRIVSYTDRSTGAILHAQEDQVTSVLIDGTARTPRVTARAHHDRAVYTLAFDG